MAVKRNNLGAVDMKSHTLTVLILLAGMVTSPVFAKSEPLPTKIDIPVDLSMVQCPNEAAMQMMLRDYYTLNGTRFDITAFFKGLEVTGCRQSSGPIKITQVIARKSLDSVHVAFLGVGNGPKPTGDVVFGIVDETLNNTHPRTASERWKKLHAPGGRLIVKTGGKKVYLCATPAAATKVVAAIPPVKQKGVNQPHQIRARDAAIKANGCTLTTGQFDVMGINKSAFISLGNEAGEEWTALTAFNRDGRLVGLLHDSNLM